MINKRHWQKAVFSAFVIWAVLLSSFPFLAQDVVTSEDFSGSNVFVFRKKASQAKAAFRSSVSVKSGQRSESRRRARSQANTVAVTQRRRTPKIDPNVVAVNRPPKNNNNKPVVINTATKEKTSIQLAGAAETFLDKNDLDNALDYFTIAVELDSNNVDAKMGLSEVYTRKGNAAADDSNYKEAVKNYEQAVKYNDKNSAAFVGLAEAYESNEMDGKAIENYEKAIALDSNLSEVYAPLGFLYFQKNDFENAEKNLTKAVTADPTNADVQYYLGLIRYKNKNYEQAVASFNQSLQSKPDSAETHYYLGESYDQLNRNQEALAEYNRAVQIDPNYVDAWFDLGVANFNHGRYEDAVNAYQKVLKLKNDYGEAHENLADVYRLMGMKSKDPDQKRKYYEQANGEYSIAAVFIKNDPELYSNWAFCLGRVEKWETSIDRLNTAVSISPAASDYSNIGWANLNSALLDKQKNKDAEATAKLEKGKAALQKAVELNPKLSAAYVNLGMTNTELGDFQAAVNALKTALDLRGDYWVLDHELGYAYRQLNDLANAVIYFKKTTELNPNYPDGFYNLGEAYYRMGNKKDAKKVQEQLQKLDPALAGRLDAIIKGAVLTNPKDKIQNKVNEKNPLNKIPKLPY